VDSDADTENSQAFDAGGSSSADKSSRSGCRCDIAGKTDGIPLLMVLLRLAF
jgi:hypothetical protein